MSREEDVLRSLCDRARRAAETSTEPPDEMLIDYYYDDLPPDRRALVERALQDDLGVMYRYAQIRVDLQAMEAAEPAEMNDETRQMIDKIMAANQEEE